MVYSRTAGIPRRPTAVDLPGAAAAARPLARRDALLAAAAQAAEVLTATPDLREGLAEAARVLGEATAVDRVNVFRYDHDRAAAFLHAEWTRPGVAPLSAVDPGPYAYAEYAEVLCPLLAGAVYHAPLAEKTGANAALNAATQTKTDLFVPVVVDGRFWGMLNFDDCTAERAWTGGEVEVLRAAAAVVGAAVRRAALERAHAEALARQREQAVEVRASELARRNALLAVAVDASRALIDAADLGAACDRVLAALGPALGVDRAGFAVLTSAGDGGVPWCELRHEWTAPGVPRQSDDPALRRTRLAGSDAQLAAFLAGDAIQATLETLPEPARAEQAAAGVRAAFALPVLVDGRPWGVLGFDDCRQARAWDAEEVGFLRIVATALAAAVQRQRAEGERAEAVARAREQAAEARAAELARANDALQAVTDALATARGHDEIVPTVLRIAAQTFGVETAGFYDHPAETVYLRYWLHEGRVLRPAELLALDPVGRHAVPRRLAEGFTVAAEYLGGAPPPRRTRAVAIDHAAGTTEPDFDAWTRVHGWEQELNVPCVVGGSARGALVLYRPAHAAYTPAEVALAEALAKQLALAMEADRLAREARDRAVDAAVARERAAAAEARGAELQRANDAMRRSVERAGAALGLDVLLEAFLLEALAVAGASGGAVDLWDGDRYLGPRCVAQDGAVVPRAAWANEPMFRDGPELLARDPAGFRTAILERGLGVATVEECDAWWPAAAAYHRSRGHRVVWNLPLRARGAAVASLGLAFRGEGPADPVTRATLEALAQQAALALELTRLGEAAQAAAVDTAVAREREQAAEVRAAELAEANEAMQRTAARLGAEQDLDAFLRQTLVEVAAQLGGATAVVTPYDSATDTFRLGALVVHGREAPADPMPGALPRADTRFMTRLLAADPYTVFDAEREPELFWPGAVAFLRAHGCRYALAFPIRLGGRLLGQLSVAYAEPPRLSAERTMVVRALSTQAALAIEVTRLGDKAREAAVARERERAAEARAAELGDANAVLQRTGAALAAGRGLAAFIASVLGEVELQARSAATALFLYDAATDALRLTAAWGEGGVAVPASADWLAPFAAPVPAAAAPSWAALLASPDPVLVHAVDDPALAWPSAIPAHRVRGHTTLGYLLLCVGDRPLGFVGLAWREAGPAALSLDQRSVLTALAQQLALAFELDRLAAVARTEATQAAVLVERTRIARDVHDTLAQGLAGIVMQIRAARAKLGAAEAPATPALDCVERLARDNLVEARRSLAMLRPAALEGYGLDAALRNVVGAARDVAGAAGAAPPGGPDLAFSVRGTPAGLPADVEMELLRIAQAALANAVEHARARVIHVDLAYDGGGAAPPDAPAGGSAAVVRIAVSDDGRGFDGDAVTADRFGLVGMSERAARVGAVLTVVTAPGEGTEVVVMWRAAPGAAT